MLVTCVSTISQPFRSVHCTLSLRHSLCLFRKTVSLEFVLNQRCGWHTRKAAKMIVDFVTSITRNSACWPITIVYCSTSHAQNTHTPPRNKFRVIIWGIHQQFNPWKPNIFWQPFVPKGGGVYDRPPSLRDFRFMHQMPWNVLFHFVIGKAIQNGVEINSSYLDVI